MRIPLPVLSVSFNSPLLPGTEKGPSVPGTLFFPFPGTENPSSVPGSRIPPEIRRGFRRNETPLRRKGRFFVEEKGVLVESPLTRGPGGSNFAAENKMNEI